MTSTDTRPKSLRDTPISKPGKRLRLILLLGLPTLFAVMYLLGLASS